MDFNKDMDKYLKNRRPIDNKFFSVSLKKEKKVPKTNEESITVYKEETKNSSKQSIWAKLFGFSKKEEEKVLRDDLNEEEMYKLKVMQKELESVDDLEAEYPKDVEELEEVKGGVFSRWLSNLRLFNRSGKVKRKAEELDLIEQEIIPQIDEDVRDVLKIVHKWLEKLDGRTKGAFKRSNDFKVYKELLEKYDLVKKK